MVSWEIRSSGSTGCVLANQWEIWRGEKRSSNSRSTSRRSLGHVQSLAGRPAGQPPSLQVGPQGPVVRAPAVVGDLARDRRGRPPEAGGDLSQRDALGQSSRNLLTFLERED